LAFLRFFGVKQKNKSVANISSTARLKEMLDEAERELETIQPKIDKLEQQLQKLKELKLAKQKLITLKLSVQSILSNYSEFKSIDSGTTFSNKNYSTPPQELNLSTKQKITVTKENSESGQTLKPAAPNGTFLPEMAFNQADAILKRKSSINYDLFRAVVFNGGSANTEQIRQYLIENQIKQPASGENFEGVALTDISARVNYLVRKGIVKPDGRGTFVSCLGWAEPSGLE
jgi:hypothetical protein